MSTIRYYVVDSAEVMAAWNAYAAAKLEVKAAGDAFAARYPGAKAVFSYSVDGMKFYGLRFEPPLTSPLWTKPQVMQGKIQRPRSSLPKGQNARGITDRAQAAIELGELLREWGNNSPKKEANTDALYRSLGADWGNFWMGGLSCSAHDGKLYIATHVELKAPSMEITGGAYNAACASASAAS
jgi:hypothetical protein